MTEIQRRTDVVQASDNGPGGRHVALGS